MNRIGAVWWTEKWETILEEQKIKEKLCCMAMKSRPTFLKTKEKRNGPELSDAIDVPAEKLDSRMPNEEREEWRDMAEEAREDQPPIDDSVHKKTFFESMNERFSLESG